MNRDKKKNRQIIFGISLFSISFILLGLRAMFGYSFNDEPFIMSLAQRLSFGDNLFIDEWHVTQNFGVILLPIYKLYLTLFKNTEGILLFCRIIYCFMWCSTCTAIYYVLRKKYACAIWVYLYLILFSPLDQMTMSYTSISLSCCLILACLFFYHFEVKNINLYIFTALFTFFMILLVISIPFIAIVYFCFIIAALLTRIIKPTKVSIYFCKVAIYSSVLCSVAILTYFFTFILQGNTFNTFLDNLPKALFDSSHSINGILGKLISYIRALVYYYKYYGIILTLSIVLLFIPKIRNSFKIKTVIFIVNALSFTLQIVYILIDHNTFALNYQMVPIVFFGVVCAFLLKEYKNHKILLLSFGIWGIVYSFFAHLASDTGLMVISMGLSVTGVASIICIYLFGKECVNGFDNSFNAKNTNRISAILKKTITILIFFTLTLQISFCLFIKINRQYLDESPLKMDTVITHGASKGLITTAQSSEMYDQRLNTLNVLLQNVNMQKKETIKFLNLIKDPVVYLNTNLPFGTFSAWTFGDTTEGLTNRYNEYYKLHPQNTPNVIFGNESTKKILSDLSIDVSQYIYFYKDDYYILISPEYIATN